MVEENREVGIEDREVSLKDKEVGKMIERLV